MGTKICAPAIPPAMGAISCPQYLGYNIVPTPKRQFNGKPDTERSRSILIIRCLHPSTPLRIQLILLFGVGSILNSPHDEK
jgi:hypothetical protein